MQMEYEKCLEIILHCYAQVEPTLIIMGGLRFDGLFLRQRVDKVTLV